ncbi:MAG: hypothetical protein ACPLZC_05355 [Candidatus Bathyarchaeales archaeon]
MRMRFCLECKNFEDRNEIDGVVLCARGHNPGTSCFDFQSKFEKLEETVSKTRFCLECNNFEEIDGVAVCARGHRPGVSCPEFQDRVVDSFYSYIYWADIYYTGKFEEERNHFEKRFSRKLSQQKLAYACLLEYFESNQDYSNFVKCWKTIRHIYERRLPDIAKIFDIASQKFDAHGERTDFRKLFSDLILSEKASDVVIKEVLEGLYKVGN